MVLHSFVLVVSVSACSITAAFAAGPVRPLAQVLGQTARESGRAIEDVRRDAIDLLRGDSRFSMSDLERIGRGEDDRVDDSVLREMTAVLARPDVARKLGESLEAAVDPAISASAERAFDQMANAPSASTYTPKPLAAEQIAKIDSDFRARNGYPKRWSLNVDRFTGLLIKGELDHKGLAELDLTLPQETLESKAREFVVKNAELFGLTAEEAGRLDVSLFSHGEIMGIGPRDIWGLSGRFADTRFPGVTDVQKSILLDVTMSRAGRIEAFSNSTSNVLPPLPLSTRELNPADDALIRKALIGAELPYFRFAGGSDEPLPSKSVEDGDIKSIRPSIYVETVDPSGPPTYTFVAKVTLGRGKLKWEAVVDVASGHVYLLTQSLW